MSLTISGCGLTDAQREANQPAIDATHSAVVFAADAVIDATPLPDPIKEPVSDYVKIGIGALAMLITEWIGKRTVKVAKKVKASHSGEWVAKD